MPEHLSDIESGYVLVEREGATAYVRMNRPEIGNAVGPATMKRLCEVLDEVIEDPTVRAIVLGHTGRHFIAGADFAFLGALTQMSATEVRRDIYQHFQGAARRLHLCPKPTVAAIGGAAITVGCELALACDFRVVTPDSVFQQSWIRVGLLPPLGGLKILPSIVGYGLAKEMILRARPIKGEEALKVGLASELVAADELESRAKALAGDLATMAPLAYAASKEELRRGMESSLEDSWEHSLTAQTRLIGSADFREGLQAVTGQRKPNFTGR